VARGNDLTAKPPVLDRLIDDEPRLAEDPAISLNESIRRYKVSVLRDLEWLLNTRRTPVPVPEIHAEVANSAFVFGIPDITSLSGDSEAGRKQVLRDIEEAIRIFEPRLTGVRVSHVEDVEGARRQVRFAIEGVLRMEPNPERVVFDSMLDLANGEIAVGGA
jgi:type VI secretion system protein ImpF